MRRAGRTEKGEEEDKKTQHSPLIKIYNHYYYLSACAERRYYSDCMNEVYSIYMDQDKETNKNILVRKIRTMKRKKSKQYTLYNIQ